MSTILVLEGLDGVGKTSVATALTSKLNEKGYRAWQAREPGATAIGEHIRKEFLLSHMKLTPQSIFYLFQVARLEMLEDLRVNHRDADYIVLDRFWPSTFAYQVYGSGISQRLYDAAHDETRKAVAAIGTEIDLCLTLPDEIRESRIRESGKGGDRFESKPKEFTDRVLAAYKFMLAKCWLHPVDASPSIDLVVDHIISFYVEH